MVEALQIKPSSLLLYEIEPNGRVVLSAKSATFEELADTFLKKRPRNPVSDEQQFATFAEAPNGVAKLRELILQLAVQGKLGTHDVNDEPASEIVRRIDAARGLKRPAHDMRPDTEGLPRGWKLVRMGQIADHRLGKMHDKAKNKGELFPYLRNTNVQWWRFALDDLKEMRFVADELTEYEVRVGDLLVCEGGEPGRCAVWSDSTRRLVFQKAIHRVRPLEGISPNFLAIRLRLDALTGTLDRQFTGATIKDFTGQELACYSFPLPPLAEQRRIVGKVTELLSLCDALEAKLTQAESGSTQLLATAVTHLLQEDSREGAKPRSREGNPASMTPSYSTSSPLRSVLSTTATIRQPCSPGSSTEADGTCSRTLKTTSCGNVC